MTVACVSSRCPDFGWRFLQSAAVVLALTAPTSVSAQPRPTGVAGADAKSKVEVPPGPLLAVVSLSKQRILVYGGTGLINQSQVSTGMAGHRTPAGVFSILERNRFHRSNIYFNAPMPYMQRLTWSGVALHGGVVPGYPASHGCIRLPHHFASELWRMTKIGTRVVVTPDDAPAVPIEHARLPAPKLTPASADDAGPGPSNVRLIDPLQRAKATKIFVVKDAAAKTKAATLAVEAAAAKAVEARRATATLRAAEQELANARRRHEAAAKAAAAPTAGERARDALEAAAAELAGAERTAGEARLIEAVASEEAAAAAAAAIETESARREAVAALKASGRAEEPISIFVSRKAGKVFIRQAFVPVHEAPVTFKEPGPAFGTHVYLAMGPSADGESMRWLSVSIPASAPEPSRQRGRKEPAQTAPASAVASESVESVLARYELAEATRRFIEDRLWPGATLIVSDNGISRETTGLYTDFIVLTR